MTSEPHGPVISLMLAVADAQAAAQWYARALGATELWNLGGVVGLTVQEAPFFVGGPANNGCGPAAHRRRGASEQQKRRPAAASRIESPAQTM